jgi:cell wall-associated NlpC family hydrolase
MKEISKFIGISYKEKDCWELAKYFYLDIMGIELKHIYDGPTPDREISANLINSSKGEFEEIKEPEFGDIILIKLFGIECHIAVYIGGGLMLHTMKNSGSVIERTSRLERQIVGYYRIKK